MFIFGMLPRTALRLSWAIIVLSLRDSGWGVALRRLFL